tara:strand:- start:111 stop:323 length:213 start_codon:yes stop_codon:yes gene_type:complete
VFDELFVQQGFKEKKAQISSSKDILENLLDKCWWNNRRSLFLVTDFLLILLLIEIAHLIEGVCPELILLV